MGNARMPFVPQVAQRRGFSIGPFNFGGLFTGRAMPRPATQSPAPPTPPASTSGPFAQQGQHPMAVPVRIMTGPPGLARRVPMTTTGRVPHPPPPTGPNEQRGAQHRPIQVARRRFPGSIPAPGLAGWRQLPPEVYTKYLFHCSRISLYSVSRSNICWAKATCNGSHLHGRHLPSLLISSP